MSLLAFAIDCGLLISWADRLGAWFMRDRGFCAAYRNVSELLADDSPIGFGSCGAR
jgi:hypothetical protein